MLLFETELCFSVPLTGQRNKWLNVRVRSFVNGINWAYGPVERIWISDSLFTQLVDEPSNSQHSCGVTRRFDANDKIWCYTIPGAVQYKFTFTTSNFTRNILKPNAQCLLVWTTLKLVSGVTYDVYVKAQLSNGVWQATGSPCTLTIDNTQHHAIPIPPKWLTTEYLIMPNPCTDGQFYLQITDIPSWPVRGEVEVINLLGQPVFRSAISIENERASYHFDLGHALPKGLYVVQIVVGHDRSVKQLVIHDPGVDRQGRCVTRSNGAFPRLGVIVTDHKVPA